MEKGGRLTSWIMITILIGGVLCTAALCIASFLSMRQQMLDTASDAVVRMASSLSSRFESEARPIVRCAESIARFDSLSSQWVLYAESVEAKKFNDYLCSVLRTTRYITSIGVLLDPEAWNRQRSEASHAPFAVRSGDAMTIADLASSRSDYLDIPHKTSSEQPYWMEPVAVEGDELSPAASFVRPTKYGAIICNVSSEWIDNALQGIKAPFDGKLSLVSSSGAVLFRETDQYDPQSTAIMEDVQSTGWRIEVAYPSEALSSGAFDASLRIAAIGVVITLITMIFSLFITRPASKSIKALANCLWAADTDSPELNFRPVGALSAETHELAKAAEELCLSVSKRIAGEERSMREAEKRQRADSVMLDVFEHFFADPVLETGRFSIGARAEFGGDGCGIFYDIVKSDRGTVYMAIGESLGDDTSPAFAICTAMSFLRSILIKCPEPNMALVQLDALLKKYWGRRCGVSLVLAELYPSTGTCSIASVGCPSAIVIRDNVPSAVDLSASGSNTVLNMGRGDALVFCTPSAAGSSAVSDRISTHAALVLHSTSSSPEAVKSLELDKGSAVMILQYR